MKRAAIKITRNILAILLAALGVVGVFVPIMPQILFFIAALLVADFERKHVVARWILSRRLVRKIGGERLHRRLARDRERTRHKAGVSSGSSSEAS